MDPPDSFIHMAANADIDNRLKERGIENIYTKDINIRTTSSVDTLAMAETRGVEQDRDPNAAYKASKASTVSVVPAPEAGLDLYSVNGSVE
jgi:hypothetical protein